MSAVILAAIWLALRTGASFSKSKAEDASNEDESTKSLAEFYAFRDLEALSVWVGLGFAFGAPVGLCFHEQKMAPLIIVAVVMFLTLGVFKARQKMQLKHIGQPSGRNPGDGGLAQP